MAAFSPQDQERVDALLTTICDAFLIPSAWRFRLRPSDDIHEFYRRNLRGHLGDFLEYVSLMQGLESRCAVSADEVVLARPCRIGSLVRLVANPRRT